MELRIEVHDLRCKPQQPLQSAWHDLPCKQETDIGALPIVVTSTLTPQPLQRLNGHVPPHEPSWVSPTPWPINPSQASICTPLPKFYTHKCWQVVFISIAWRLAVLLEYGKISLVRDYFRGEISIHRKPLGPLSPLFNCDCWIHLLFVSAAANWTREIIGLYIISCGVHEVRVDGWEIEEGYAWFWEENKMVVWEIKESIG